MGLSRYVLIAMATCMTAPVWGQSPTDAAKPPSQTPATAPATPTAPTSATPAPGTSPPAVNTPAPGPSRDLIARAKTLGLTPETHGGVTSYCKKDVPVGTRFPVKTCYREDDLQQQVDQLEAQKNQMRRGTNQ